MQVSPGEVLLSEVLYDPAAPAPDPGGEWVIVRNATTRKLHLVEWRLRDAKAETVLPTIDLRGGEAVWIGASQAVRPDNVSAAQVITLPGRIGNGLGNSGDSLALLDERGQAIDALSWGEDRSVFDPPAPLVQPGQTLRRLAAMDTDTAADWSVAGAVTSRIPAQTTTARPRHATTGPTATTSQPESGGAATRPAPPLAAATQPASASPQPTMPQAQNTAVGNVVLSEVAPGDGWVELYNRGAASASVEGWSLADDQGSDPVALEGLDPLPPHGFVVVVAKTLRLGAENGHIFLIRPDGSTVDTAPVGPAGAHLGWSRYPVHGGAWLHDAPLTPGRFNQPPLVTPEPSAEGQSPADSAAEGTVQAIAVQRQAVTQPANGTNRFMLLMAVLAVGVLLRQLVWRPHTNGDR
jgi:hypothetical protein